MKTKLINQIDDNINEIETFNRKLNDSIKEIKQFGKKYNIDTGLSFEKLYNNSDNKFYSQVIDSSLDELFKHEEAIDELEKIIDKSNVRKFYLTLLMSYFEEFYDIWRSGNTLKSDFDKNIIRELSGFYSEKNKNFDYYQKMYFKLCRKIFNYKKRYDEAIVDTIFESWFFYLILFVSCYDEAVENVNDTFLNPALDLYNIIKTQVEENAIIDKSLITNLKVKFGIYSPSFNMNESYTNFQKLADKYNFSFKTKKKEENSYREKPNVKTTPIISINNLISREERIKLYEEKKHNGSRYIDEDINLTYEQIEASVSYVNEVVLLSENNFDINLVLELLPYDNFEDEIIMLQDIISRLKSKNINHNTNKLLVVLNNMLKKNISKKINKHNKRNN